ncbi:hypothetical protein JTB14_024217 [Gonioctena quinquepunctata]|nr:hypothetical protein JTB14_024217 [Gonioctena quinquepunctata]
MSKKNYDEFRIPHGYHFDTNYINKDKNAGSFTGHCECGSILKCMILPRLEQEEIVKIECVATKADSEKFGNCHKRQCRGETRKEVVAILEKQSVEAYRAQVAAQNMQERDSYEPPHLYKGDVLRTAMYQSEQKKYQGRNVVRDIGSDPVIVHFWSPHQIRIFNNMNKIENARLCIDATGKLAKYVLHVNNEKSHHIFLYIGVLYCSAGQFSVMEMFSESQDTVSVSTWLRRWIQSGAQFPKEVVCDSSRALLNAYCWAFTGYDTIEKYAEACVKNEFVRTFIGIDVAHYIKNWADFLKTERKLVKKFYLFAIGRLILCRNQNDARRISKALMIISMSDTGGVGANSLAESLEFIKNLIVEKNNENEEIEQVVDLTLRQYEAEELEIKEKINTVKERAVDIHDVDANEIYYEDENEHANIMTKWA